MMYVFITFIVLQTIWNVWLFIDLRKVVSDIDDCVFELSIEMMHLKEKQERYELEKLLDKKDKK